MIGQHPVTAITLARGGSKRVPTKNMAFISGKPLIKYTIDQVRGAQFVDRHIVSSDDDDLDIKRQGVRLTQVLVGLDVKPVQGMRVCLSTEGLSAFDEVVLNISRKGLGRITKVMHSGIVA